MEFRAGDKPTRTAWRKRSTGGRFTAPLAGNTLRRLAVGKRRRPERLCVRLSARPKGDRRFGNDAGDFAMRVRGADVCRNMAMRVGRECRRTRGSVGRPGRRGRAVFEFFGREIAPVFLRAASLAGAVGPPLPVALFSRLRKRAAICDGRWRPGRSGGRVGNREDANGPADLHRRPGRSRREAIVDSGEADRRLSRLVRRRPGRRKGARRRRTTAR